MTLDTLEGERARAMGELPGWDVWYVPIHMPRGTRWCGKPAGADTAVAWGDSPGELVEHAREWAQAQQEAKPTAEGLGIDLAAQQWTRSGASGGSLEVAVPDDPRWERGDWVLMRVAGSPDGLVSVFDRNEWECFLDGARNGEFDDMAEDAAT